jgi:hypothetical protein
LYASVGQRPVRFADPSHGLFAFELGVDLRKPCSRRFFFGKRFIVSSREFRAAFAHVRVTVRCIRTVKVRYRFTDSLAISWVVVNCHVVSFFSGVRLRFGAE